jgi:hypothetical protein
VENILANKCVGMIENGVFSQAADGNWVVNRKRSVPISILTLSNLMHPAGCKKPQVSVQKLIGPGLMHKLSP